MNTKQYWSSFRDYKLYRKETVFDNLTIYGEKPERRKFIAEYISDLKPTSVLEIGCMFGNNLINIRTFNESKKQSCTYTGCDINENIIKNTSEEGIEFVHQDIFKYNPAFENKFDIVFSVGVMIHIPTEEVRTVADNLKSYSKKYIIHFEEHGEDFIKRPQPARRYISNYNELYSEYEIDIQIARDLDISGGGVEHLIKVTK